MRARTICFGIVMVLAFAACGGDDDGADVPSPTDGGVPATGAVDVVDSRFEPSVTGISAGGAITWTQTGGAPHTVTADDGAFDSHPNCDPAAGASCMAQGDTFTQTFDVPGEFDYYCKVHGAPGGVGMSGTITVT